ncbi:MAG TPA: glycosyltransferase family 2 protein [Longimicrobiaceae bacterium]|nr:glycosyltransferase family 2 protein [Longimicrobiaceae bacterium]
MHALLLALAVLAAAGQAVIFAEMVVGNRRLRFLHDVPAPGEGEIPPISVIVAARNEARGVRQGVASLLRLRGVAEVIAVDDRTEDATGAILDELAAGDPRLRVVHVEHLPAGWLGKNHALWRGAEAASGGELLLFTDADVVMEPEAAERAAAYLVREGMDHVTVAPEIRMPGRLLSVFGIAFGLFFSVFARPWKARDPRSSRHVGIGAFNLVRAPAYRAAGTHRAIAMRPDDDMKLAKILKKTGHRQDFLIGSGMLHVEWYASVRETVQGLKKNAFAGLDYSLAAVVASTLVHLLVFSWPWGAVWIARGWAQGLYAAAIVLMLVLFAGSARVQRVPLRYAVLFPVACLLFVYVVWNGTAYVLRTGGIEWRGTRYPLAELKANRV